MANQASTPKGTRDFSPSVMLRRNFIFDTIRKEFQLHGYLPLETPAMENLSTLLGKYGDEGDKLLFRILNSGDFMSSVSEIENTSDALAEKITEKGLRYDLTVPFARYVVQHNNDIAFPFKRYQIQPVWRADKPQRGRYREFYQCDADIVGSNSLLNEAELINVLYKVFTQLKINVAIKINNRKILAAISEMTGNPDKITDLTVAIDKLDKMGEEKVMAELSAKGFSDENLEMLKPLLHLSGDNTAKLKTLEDFVGENETGKTGLEELKQVLSYCDVLQENMPVELDVTLARGLNYYTGAIIEVKAKDVAIGSISGGGRYDDLTGVFGLKGVSGVGVSFGADRIYDVMEQLELFPEDSAEDIKVLFINFGGDEELKSIEYVQKLRSIGIPAEIYPDSVKMKKQFTYANKRSIPYTAIIGQDELQSGKITLKDMKSGNQSSISVDELIGILKK